MKTGIKGFQKEFVTEEKTALAMGSGELAVYATPAMIALMEKAAFSSVAAELDEGQGTVGTLINVSHVSATPCGMEVRCESELIDVDGRRLVFSVKAYDEAGLIGEAMGLDLKDESPEAAGLIIADEVRAFMRKIGIKKPGDYDIKKEDILNNPQLKAVHFLGCPVEVSDEDGIRLMADSYDNY